MRAEVDTLRSEFLLDPEIVFLNHGSYGACPRAVFERYRAWQLELERQPVEFLGRRLDQLLAEARRALATELGADPDDLVFVPNASTGVNLAAWGLDLQPGDEVLSTDLEYGALNQTWAHVSQRTGARYVRTHVPLPLEREDDALEAVWSGVSERTRALFVSHITSSTAIRLPVEELCRRARARGIATIVDGAHAPGQIPLDLRAVDADFYAGNCHKWLCAPKGAGFLHVRRELQAGVHPLVIGWGYADDPTFVRRHELQGTRDPAAYLTVPAAIDWLAARDWDAIRDRCFALARRLRGEVDLEPVCAPELLGQMVAWRLPENAPADIQERLYSEHRIEIPVTEHAGGRLLRASVAGYTTEAELTHLRDALRTLL